MTAFTFHLSDGLAGRTDTVSGDEIETLDQVREAVAQAGSEAMRSLARSSIWGGRHVENGGSRQRRPHGLCLVDRREVASAMEAKATDDDAIVREEEAAIAAENHKIAAAHKAEAEADATRVEEAIRDLRRPAKPP